MTATNPGVAPAGTDAGIRLWPSIRRGLLLGAALLTAGLAALLVVVPALTGATALTVLTGSMDPTLPAGTVIVVRPAAAEDVRVGDVITFHPRPEDPAVVTHRVVGVTSGSDGRIAFVTKGDANDATDAAQVVEEQVVGTVWYSLPLVGTIRVALDPHLPWLRPFVGTILVFAGVLLMARRWVRIRSLRRQRARFNR